MPLRVKVGFPVPDRQATEAEIHAAMIDHVVDACKTWVIATTDQVPVLTGASKASFLKIASKAKVSLTITPKKKSRIPWGIATSEGEFIFERGKVYGWRWASDLPYIHIVDQRYDFLRAGEATLNSNPVLPQPIYVSSGNG